MTAPETNPEALRIVAGIIYLHYGAYTNTTLADAERAAKAVLRNLPPEGGKS